MKGPVMSHLWFCSLIIGNARLEEGRQIYIVWRNCLEEGAERFMCEAVFAERSGRVHLIIWPDTPSLFAYRSYADISTNVVLITPTKRCMVTRFYAYSAGHSTRVSHTFVHIGHCVMWRVIFFFLWRYDPTRVMASSFTRFLDHTKRRTTVGRTPLDEWSARRRDLYLTKHNTHNRQTSMPPVGF